MSKKTAPPDDQSDVEVTPKGEPVDLAAGQTVMSAPGQDSAPTTEPEAAEPMAEAHAQDVEAQATDDLDLDTAGPDTGLEEIEPELPIFTPVNAMEQFEIAMHEHPNSCLKHLLAEWKAQEREARKFEARQRVRGDL